MKQRLRQYDFFKKLQKIVRPRPTCPTSELFSHLMGSYEKVGQSITLVQTIQDLDGGEWYNMLRHFGSALWILYYSTELTLLIGTDNGFCFGYQTSSIYWDWIKSHLKAHLPENRVETCRFNSEHFPVTRYVFNHQLLYYVRKVASLLPSFDPQPSFTSFYFSSLVL